jgi:hypothetical protein
MYTWLSMMRFRRSIAGMHGARPLGYPERAIYVRFRQLMRFRRDLL